MAKSAEQFRGWEGKGEMKEGPFQLPTRSGQRGLAQVKFLAKEETWEESVGRGRGEKGGRQGTSTGGEGSEAVTRSSNCPAGATDRGAMAAQKGEQGQRCRRRGPQKRGQGKQTAELDTGPENVSNVTGRMSRPKQNKTDEEGGRRKNGSTSGG